MYGTLKNVYWLYTGSVDKLTVAGVIGGGAAADDMKVNIYILLQ
jgi:peroxiredoxin family protein